MFRVIRSMLDLTELEDEVYWKYVHDFIHSRIVMPDGNIYQVHRGVPSGSASTSLIGSMVNLYLMNYIWFRTTGHALPHNQVLVMGDDAIVATNQYVKLADIAAAAQELGFTINVEKSAITHTREEKVEYQNETHFLGHYWRYGKPHRPKHEVVTRAAMPEYHRERRRRLSLIRLGGYALTSIEGFRLMMDLYPNLDTVSAVAQYLWDCRESEEEDDQYVVRARDLPGELRRRVSVEGEPLPELVQGTGLHTILFALAS
jgi:hypothetical protein